MPLIEVLYPVMGTVDLDEVIPLLRHRSRATRAPFSAATIEFLDGLARGLFALARREPALAPLAFFLRRANTSKLSEGALSRVPAETVPVPQGSVLHIPPTNVDTLFLYTLGIALLAGNANIVRISENAGPATTRIVDLLKEGLEAHPEVAESVTIVRYGHDPAVLGACTDVADVRMIWGGDASINAVRRAPLRPHASELTFPDRISFAAIGSDAYYEATDDTRRKISEALYNDTFWFDQMACSSPVQLVLVGGSDSIDDEIMHDLLRRVDSIARSRYETVEGQAINKMVAAVQAFAGGARSMDWVSNDSVALGVVTLKEAEEIRPGGGFFTTQRVQHLDELIPQVNRRVQTLSTFGLTRSELTSFVSALNGQGIDRVVPIGHALDFDAVWDGKDLVTSMLRFVSIQATS